MSTADSASTRKRGASRWLRSILLSEWTSSTSSGRPEGKTLEFKRDLSSPEGALRTVVALANTAGGTLLIGVEDRTRRVRGIADALDLEERIANLVSDSIAPRLVPDIEILRWRSAR